MVPARPVHRGSARRLGLYPRPVGPTEWRLSLRGVEAEAVAAAVTSSDGTVAVTSRKLNSPFVPWVGEKMMQRARALWALHVEASSDVLFAEDVPSSVTRDECVALGELARGKTVLEVGSYLGRSTIALAGTAAVVHSVDLHPPSEDESVETTAGSFVRNIERYGLRHKVVLHIGFSQLVLPLLAAKSFDMVFLDGQHQLDPVREDVAAILPLLKDDAVLAFHDYGVPGVEHKGVWDDFGVTQVVDEFAASRGLALDVTGTVAVVRLRD